MKRLPFFILLSPLVYAQAPPDQLLGHLQTQTGYYNPAGPDATVSWKTINGQKVYCSGWLSRDSANGGCYPSPYYHLGQDLLVSTPTYTDGTTPSGVGHLVYAIADGEIQYISHRGWGQTACAAIKAAAPRFDQPCPAGQSLSNVAVVIKHKSAGGNGYFLGIYGHVLNYNLLTGRAFQNPREEVLHSTVTKGQAFAVIGNWDNGVHLHFGIFPNFRPESPHYPTNFGLANDTDAADPKYGYYDSTGRFVLLIPDWATNKTFGLTDPVAWLTSTVPDNYITNQTTAAINQTAMPSSVSVPLGGVVIVPWQVQALGLPGAIQGNIVVSPDPSNSSLRIQSLLDSPKVLNANQTVSTQNLLYAPSSLGPGNYFANVQTQFRDNQGGLYSTSPTPIQLQVGQTGPSGQAIKEVQWFGLSRAMANSGATSPTILALATSGQTAVAVATTFTVYISATSVDPVSVQAILTGPGCSGECMGTMQDSTTTSYVGTFPTPSQPGTYVLRLRNGDSGALSNPENVVIYPSLIPTCSPNSQTVATDSLVTFTGQASGGAQPYSFNWDNGISASGDQVTTSFPSGGVLAAVDLYVTDSLGNQDRATCGVGVSLGNATIDSLALLDSAPAASTGFAATVSGTNFDQSPGNLQVWFCQLPKDSPCYRQSSAGILVSGDINGSVARLTGINLPAGGWHTRVRNGGTGTWSNFSDTFTVAPKSTVQLSVSCSVTPPIITEGQLATFKVVVSGGTSPLKYLWSGAVSGTSQSIGKTFSTAGMYWVQYTVTDSSIPQQTQTGACSLQVSGVTPAPSAPSISGYTLPTTPVASQPFSLSLFGNSFDLNTIQVWFFGSSSCLAGCRQPAAGVTNVSAGAASLINIRLANDTYRIRVKNGDTGAWSLASQAFVVQTAAYALGVFTGSWVNDNPASPGLTRIQFRTDGQNIFVHMWGKCHPVDCDWKEASAPIGSASTGSLSLAWNQGFAVQTQQLTLLADGRISVNTNTHFIDNSGRQDYASTEYFHAGGDPHPQAGFFVAIGGQSLYSGGTLSVAASSTGTSVTFYGSANTYEVSGGGVTSWEWTDNGGSLSGSNGTSTFSQSLYLGTHNLALVVTDSRGLRSPAATATLTLAATPLSASCVVNGQSSPVILQVGNQATFVVTVSGGTAPIHYVWTGISGNDSNAALQIYNNPGTYNVSVAVSDSATSKQQTTASCPQVTVSAPSSFTLGTLNSSKSVQAGQATSFDIGITPTNGFTGLVTWQVSGLPTGVSITNGSQQVNVTANGGSFAINLQSTTATAAGTYSLTVTGTSGVITQTLSLILTITSAPLSGSCVVNGQTSPLTLQVGNQATFVVNANGGTTPLHYSWSGIAGNDSNAASQIYNTAGTYDVSALVYDSAAARQQITVGCPRVTVPTPPAISAYCGISPNPLILGNSATLSAGAIGGVSPYQFVLPGSGSYTSSSTTTVKPTATGQITYQVTARDSVGQTNSASCSVQVNLGDPFLTNSGATPNPVRAGQVVTVKLWGGNFVAGQTQVALVGPGCSLGSCLSSAVTVSSNAYMEAGAILNRTGNYTVSIRNGSGSWVSVSGLTITVNP